MTYLGSHVSKSRIKIHIIAVQRPCVTHDGCRRRRIRSSLSRPGLGDAARFQHRFGVLSETFSHNVVSVVSTCWVSSWRRALHGIFTSQQKTQIEFPNIYNYFPTFARRSVSSHTRIHYYNHWIHYYHHLVQIWGPCADCLLFAVDLPAHICAPAMTEGFYTAHLMITTNQKNHTSKCQLVQPMRKCLQWSELLHPAELFYLRISLGHWISTWIEIQVSRLGSDINDNQLQLLPQIKCQHHQILADICSVDLAARFYPVP